MSGRLGAAWKVDLKAAPAEGKANEECLRFLAEVARVPRASVRLVAGAAGRTKIVEVEGVTQAELEARLLLSGV